MLPFPMRAAKPISRRSPTEKAPLMSFVDLFQLSVPLIQAPMAGVSSPRLAASVCRAGGLGSIAVGATNAAGARRMIDEVRGQTDRPYNVNLFVHESPRESPDRETAWLQWLAPRFGEFGATPPSTLKTIYNSFADDPDMLAMLLDVVPPVLSFHFGLPPADMLSALRARGIYLMATATSLEEARSIDAAGIDAIVAQGIEAGGHRGVFNPDGHDDALGTMALTRLLVRESRLPIIAAGGIMNGAGIAAALDLGAVAAQLGTAFIGCPESTAEDAYRAALTGPGAYHTTLTRLISGRPARALPNRFTALVDQLGACLPPDYPIAYDAGKALHAAAKVCGEYGFGAYWAGQGAPFARIMPAADLVLTLQEELERSRT